MGDYGILNSEPREPREDLIRNPIVPGNRTVVSYDLIPNADNGSRHFSHCRIPEEHIVDVWSEEDLDEFIGFLKERVSAS